MMEWKIKDNIMRKFVDPLETIKRGRRSEDIIKIDCVEQGDQVRSWDIQAYVIPRERSPSPPFIGICGPWRCYSSEQKNMTALARHIPDVPVTGNVVNVRTFVAPLRRFSIL
jgi:hypothetical protein